MKKEITSIIKNYITEYKSQNDVKTSWGEPIVGFADARHADILELKNVIGKSHALPTDVVKDATIVVAYFLPISKEIADTNKDANDIASPEWALAYEETNALLAKINEHLVSRLTEMGYDAGTSPEATQFDEDNLVSNWSQRHFAKAAGLGTFGMNNMLITEHGCCGRYSTVVTNLDTTPDSPLETELCLYKSKGTCGACIKRCPSGALTVDGFDRHKCYEVCKKNARLYTDLGNSYDEDSSHDSGSEVCGKCVVNVPCTYLSDCLI